MNSKEYIKNIERQLRKKETERIEVLLSSGLVSIGAIILSVIAVIRAFG